MCCARSASKDLRRDFERDSNDDKVNSFYPAERRLKPNSRRFCDRRSDANRAKYLSLAENVRGREDRREDG
jgi:hypothetical protein